MRRVRPIVLTSLYYYSSLVVLARWRLLRADGGRHLCSGQDITRNSKTIASHDATAAMKLSAALLLVSMGSRSPETFEHNHHRHYRHHHHHLTLGDNEGADEHLVS